jgi:formylglycine-generating enzyme
LRSDVTSSILKGTCWIAGWALAPLAIVALYGGGVEAASPIVDCKSYSGVPAEAGEKAGMVFVPDGSFIMGSDRDRPEERFSHEVRVDGLWIDRHEVTKAEFAEFVKATGYVTLAERGIDPKTRSPRVGPWST